MAAGEGVYTLMNSKSEKGKIALFLVVILLAAAYFSPSATRFLNAADEGYLLYNFERVARGDIPHRDFYDIYGALTHFLGGGLFKLFGVKLLPMRIFVIGLMALMAGLIFLIGCRVMPRRFAFLGSVFFMFYWGSSFFPKILYGNHCAHFLALLSVLCAVAYTDSGKKSWILMAGFCAGTGILFKLPTGVFNLMVIGLFLSLKEQFLEIAQPCEDASNHQNLRLVRISRLSKLALLIMVAVVFTLYFLAFHLDLAHFVIFLLPLFLFLGWMLSREISILRALNTEESSARWTSFRGFLVELILLGAGPLFLFLLQCLFYYFIGGLDEMLYDTFLLPSQLNYYYPMESSGLHAVLIIAACGLIVLAAWSGRHLADKSGLAKSVFFFAVLAVLVAPTVYVFAYNVAESVWSIRVSHIVPTVSLLVVFSLLLMLKENSREEVKFKLILSLYFIFSCLFFISSFPRTDMTHIVFASTVIFVLVALLLQRLDQGGRRVFGERARARRYAWVVAAFMLIGLSFLWTLRIYFTWEVFRLTYPRAQGWDVHEHEGSVNMIKTIDFIRDNTLADERIFVVSQHQAIYFLSERDTPLMKKNYFTYLSSTGFINADSAVRLKDEEIIEKMQEAKPRFIVEEHDMETRNFLRAWPKTAQYLRAAYSPVASFGKFEILQRRGS